MAVTATKVNGQFQFSGRAINITQAKNKALEPYNCIVHGGEVDQIAADAVNFPDDEVGKLASADAIHHGLIFGAVGVLG